MSSRKNSKRKTAPRASAAPARADPLTPPTGPAGLIADFGAIPILPFGPEEREKTRRAVEIEVNEHFFSLLSPADRKNWLDPATRGDKELTARASAALDRVILARASDLSWRLFLLPRILHRLAEWQISEPRGDDLYRKLGNALARGALVQQGKAKLPVSPLLPQFKQVIQEELKGLLRLLRAKGLLGRNQMTTKNAVAEIVHRPDHPFPRLFRNWTAFESFLEARPNAFPSFRIGHLSPAQFVNEWIAWSLNRATESTRQAMSNVHGRSSK